MGVPILLGNLFSDMKIYKQADKLQKDEDM